MLFRLASHWTESEAGHKKSLAHMGVELIPTAHVIPSYCRPCTDLLYQPTASNSLERCHSIIMPSASIFYFPMDVIRQTVSFFLFFFLRALPRQPFWMLVSSCQVSTTSRLPCKLALASHYVLYDSSRSLWPWRRNRTKRKWSVQADEEAYPRIPSGYIRRKPRGMFAYLKPPPPLLGEENDQHVQQEEGQTQEEHLERPQASEKNDNPIIQPKDKSQSIDFGFSWAVPFMPAQQKVEKPFGNNDKAHTSRKNSFLPGAHHLPWFMTWDNNTWPGKTGDHLMECEEEPQHYHSTICK